MLYGDINYGLRYALSIRWLIAQETLMADKRHIIHNRNMDLKRGVMTKSTMFAGERERKRHLLNHLPYLHIILFIGPLVTK